MANNNMFNAAKAREITTQAIANMEREERKKIDEALVNTIFPLVEKTAQKGLYSIVVTVEANVNMAKLEKVLVDELGFSVTRKNTEFSIKW